VVAWSGRILKEQRGDCRKREHNKKLKTNRKTDGISVCSVSRLCNTPPAVLYSEADIVTTARARFVADFLANEHSGSDVTQLHDRSDSSSAFLSCSCFL
jgi:hypothetical protein